MPRVKKVRDIPTPNEAVMDLMQILNDESGKGGTGDFCRYRIRHHGVTTKGWNGCFGSDSVDHASPRIR